MQSPARRTAHWSVLTAFFLLAMLSATVAQAGELSFAIAYDPVLSNKPVDGRLILLIAKTADPEPRFQVAAGVNAIQMVGRDVDGWKAGEAAVIDGKLFGYPVASLDQLPAGDYVVQAVFHHYETFKRKDGHVVKLPMDRGEGQHWNLAPGNFLSQPQPLKVEAGGKQRVPLLMSSMIGEIEPPKDTKYVRHIKIESKLLSEFWGRPMHLGAHVLVPEGFDEHPEARYPLMVFHGHFPHDFGGFSTDPPDPNLAPDYSERFKISGYNKIQQQEAYDFYKKWTSPGFPRFLIIEIQHANPYYDDSYAVNSANLGPYGDAIHHELIPEIERRFRGIGEGWARFTYGGSTGGWEALAVQVLYPEMFNGAFAACPDPIDFSAYTTIDLYNDTNAYYRQGDFQTVQRPAHRNYLGHVDATVQDMNHMELVLGENSRSGDQFDIWEAVYSPVGSNGYPARIFDKKTGVIDKKVAAYWKENYDLRHILERDWATLGPKLVGKIHIYCGDMDNYYLNNAVYNTEEFLEKTTNPYYGGEVDYGDRAEHCWNGDQENPNYISRLRYNTMYLPKILKRIEQSAPAGADLKSWRY